MIKEDKTTSWIETDYMKVMTFWLWLFRNHGLIVESKHNNASVDPTNHTAKMCLAYLKLHNEHIPASVAEKREAVSKHKNAMTMHSKNVQKVKVQPIVRSSHKITAILMTSNENNVDDCKTHMK